MDPSQYAAEVSFMLHVQNFGFRLNLALSRFSPEDRRRIGVHSYPGDDLDSTHSPDVDYAVGPAGLFELKSRSSYIALAGERDGPQVPRVIPKRLKPDQWIFVGVIAPIDVCSLIKALRGWSA
jgi:5-methyltetrahydropteroyltriglutamate--homocysteine methyltransferase